MTMTRNVAAACAITAIVVMCRGVFAESSASGPASKPAGLGVIQRGGGPMSRPASAPATKPAPKAAAKPASQPAPLSASGIRKDALWHLQNSPKPVFAKDHTLIPLTRWGWSMTFPVKVELCQNWGYALEFVYVNKKADLDALNDPCSEASKLCALTASDPKRYPLSILVPRPLLDPAHVKSLPESTWCHDANGDRFVTKEPNGRIVPVSQWRTWSPEAPDEIFQKVAAETVEILDVVKAKAPIAVLLNGGEYGMSVAGHCMPYWSKDPKVLAAKGSQEWPIYLAKCKARQEGIISKAVQAAFPDRRLYIWYHFMCMPGSLAPAWTNHYDEMRGVSDMPDQSLYYKEFNSGWTGANDLLSMFLASVGLASKYGDTISYNWVCAGWEGNKSFSDRDRYMGYLKCLYTGGQVGACAGYFSVPKPGFADDQGDQIPSWLWQMMDLAEAQAMFSHLEDFIRKGDLLSGPEKNRLVADCPSCEFATGDKDARVMVRKLKGKDLWLVTAWAAAGDSRQVTVTVPDLGSITVQARPCGSVYRAELAQTTNSSPAAPKLTLLDEDGMHPSAGFAKTNE